MKISGVDQNTDQVYFEELQGEGIPLDAGGSWVYTQSTKDDFNWFWAGKKFEDDLTRVVFKMKSEKSEPVFFFFFFLLHTWLFFGFKLACDFFGIFRWGFLFFCHRFGNRFFRWRF